MSLARHSNHLAQNWESLVPTEGYSLVVKWSIVDRLCWVRFPIVLRVKFFGAMADR